MRTGTWLRERADGCLRLLLRSAAPPGRPRGGAPRPLARPLHAERGLGRGGGRIWIPRRLGELVAGVAILPLGAVATLTVAGFSSPSAGPVQGPPLSSASSLLRFHILPLGDPLQVGSSGISTPVLVGLPPVPRLSPLRVVDGTQIPADTYTAAGVEAIITQAADAHGVAPAWMISTAECESRLHPNSLNPSGPYYGLFQFLMSTFRAHGGTNIWDPVQQADIAASMFASGDSSAWPVCSLA